MEFLGIGLPELLVIIVLTLLVVGPQRLPETVAQFARWVRQFRSYSANIRKELGGVLEGFEQEYGELGKELREAQKEMRTISGSVNADLRSVTDTVKGGTPSQPAQLPPPAPAPTPSPPPKPSPRPNAGDWWDDGRSSQ